VTDHSELSEIEIRVRALESILTEKGYLDPAAVDAITETYETRIGPRNGATVVAKAWLDDGFAEWLRTDSDLRDVAGAFLPAGTEASEDQLRAVAGALRNVVERHARYRCSDCGLDSSTFLWQCPGCKSWDTLRAIAALEFLPRAARPRSPG